MPSQALRSADVTSVASASAARQNPGQPLATAARRSVRAGLAARWRGLTLDQWLGWLAPLAITVIAGVMRFRNLANPHAFVFDETYYAKDAWALLKFGHEREWQDSPDTKDINEANVAILQGNTEMFRGPTGTDGASFIAHPPAGKWVIAIGEWHWGLTPFGWRVMVALLGTLSILMIARIARRLLGSTLLGCIAATLLALDGLHFVESRTALLDLILMFFALAGFGFLLLDRDFHRWWLARRHRRATQRHRLKHPDASAAAARRPSGIGRYRLPAGWQQSFGPGVWFRPFLVLSGVMLGLAAATKWSGAPFVAVFGVTVMAWNYAARRSLHIRRPALGTLLRDSVPAFLALVGSAALAYTASWWGWFVTDTGHKRHSGITRPFHPEGEGVKSALLEPVIRAANAAISHMPEVWRDWFAYHQEMWHFNSTLNSPHPYQSNPWSWLVLGRPVSFFYEGKDQGVTGCGADQCSRAILGIGTPAIWWASILAIVVVVFCWALRRDWRAGAIVAGLAASYLPWFGFQGRTIYAFYGVIFLPWLVLALTYCLGLLLGPRGASPTRRVFGAGMVGGYLLLVLLNFVYFYPIFTAEVITYQQWANRIWFPFWI